MGRSRERKSADGSTGVGVIGSSAAMQAVRAAIAAAARSGAPVLITGACGTGKSLVARAIHADAERITTWTRWAAPGAIGCGCGFSCAADGSGTDQTVLIDDLGDLLPRCQSRLLTALDCFDAHAAQGRGTARIIAVTHHDLPAAIARGTFRADLYHRITGLCIDLPGLERRIEDIPELVAHFARSGARGARRGMAVGFSARALARLARTSWEGHVRQLRNVVERAATASAHAAILGEAELARHLPQQRNGEQWRFAEESFDLDATLGTIERHHIRTALACAGGIVAEAARMLGIRRTTLIDRIRKHGLQSSEPASQNPAWDARQERIGLQPG